MERFDVVVLGAGTASDWMPPLARAGKSVVVIEAARVGGECPYVACMPSKSMLRSAQVRRIVATAQQYGAVSTPLRLDDPQAGYAAAVARRDTVADHRDDHDQARIMTDAGITIVRGWGRVVGPGVIDVAGRELGYSDLVLNTGSQPIVPSIPGLDQVPTWTSDQALSAAELPSSLIVLGGGPIGCELSQVFARFGVQVTVIDSGSRLLPREEPSIAEALADVLCAEGITLHLGQHVQAAERCSEGARLHLEDGTTLTAARVLVATGRVPRTEHLGLDVLGIQVGDDGLLLDDHCRVRAASSTCGRRVMLPA